MTVPAGISCITGPVNEIHTTLPIEIARHRVQGGCCPCERHAARQPKKPHGRSPGPDYVVDPRPVPESSAPPDVTGTNKSAGFPGQIPRKSGGPMPTMVAGCPFSRRMRPTARGSAPSCACQKRLLTTTT